jgi:hypothetical protein
MDDDPVTPSTAISTTVSRTSIVMASFLIAISYPPCRLVFAPIE